MGQKVNPIGLRIGINKNWVSRWTANKKDFGKFILEDENIRKFLKKEYVQASVSTIEIERTPQKTTVNIHTARPGVLIGVKGAGIEVLKKQLEKIVSPEKKLFVNIKEIKNADLDATLVAESIASQLEKRVAFRRALKMAIQRVMRAGVKGCKVQVSGPVDGASSIARTENYMEGTLPLHTLRADIEYGVAAAYTAYGKIGVKVWINKGEILGKKSLGGQKDATNA